MKQFASTHVDRLSRREFLKITAGLGLSAAAMTVLEACGVQPRAVNLAEEKLETTSIKMPMTSGLCHAPQYLAEDILKSEGFTDVQYVKMTSGQIIDSLVAGETDISLHFDAPSIVQIAAGTPISFLSGVHVGCFKLFGTNQVQTISDLKGKTVAVAELGGSDHVFVSIISAYVGLDPNKDINWAVHPVKEAKQLFTDGKIDAFLAVSPLAQELESKKIGRVLLNSMMDTPWSQYVCCMATVRRDFLQQYPVATKRALRAILQGSDICASQPEKAARLVVDRGFTDNYDYALQAMHEIPYDVWREINPEDTVRFFSLRLREIGMIRSNPDEILSKGTDWRFLNELKTELKA
jgi:NitT/TauT family transport system substrate-binding protein